MSIAACRQRLIDYLSTSYRRNQIDSLLEAHRSLYTGVVLDIGGRDRGRFKKPRASVTRWIFADIVPDFHPDILLDVTAMGDIQQESIDVINAIEVFEHVAQPEQGIAECFRVLKRGGAFIASTPFLYGLHADPHDYQRWTGEKWRLVLKEAGFSEIVVTPMGSGISVTLDMCKLVLRHCHPIVKYGSFLCYPLFDLFNKLDGLSSVQRSMCGRFVGGYFIVARKKATAL